MAPDKAQQHGIAEADPSGASARREPRGVTVIHGLRPTPDGDKPWVARMTHDPDPGYSMLVLAGAALGMAERPLFSVAGGGAPSLSLNAEALANRLITDSSGDFYFDALFKGGQTPAVFGNELTLLQFGRPEDGGISRLQVVDCQARNVRVYGHALPELRGSAAEHLAFGPIPPEATNSPSRAARSPAVDVAQALAALASVGWTVNARSPRLALIENEARDCARAVFEQDRAARLAGNLGVELRCASAEPKGAVLRGQAALVGDKHLYQLDPESKTLWIHATEDFGGAVPREGQWIEVKYRSPTRAQFVAEIAPALRGAEARSGDMAPRPAPLSRGVDR